MSEAKSEKSGFNETAFHPYQTDVQERETEVIFMMDVWWQKAPQSLHLLKAMCTGFCLDERDKAIEVSNRIKTASKIIGEDNREV